MLALQMGFVTRDGLIAAMHAWVLDQNKPLGHILREQGQLGEDRLALLDALVREHLRAHGGDAQQSLASLSSVSEIRDRLGKIGCPKLDCSLVHLGAQAPPELGSTVDEGRAADQRYRILRPHAQGGLGAVFVAEDRELHREVALKEIQERHAHDLASRGRFVLEAEITGGLEHPGIVPVYGLGTYADGRPFYTMRFIRGDNLKDAIQRFHQADGRGRDPSERSVAFRQLLRRFLDVCNAVAYAHSRGVLHRDLKPGNVMLGKYGETLVVDWGLAKVVGSERGRGDSDEPGELTLQPTSGSGAVATQAGTALGTPAYMSPEQAAGRLDLLGPASDVYSLGATLYAVLTGKPPLDGADAGQVLQQVQRGDWPSPRQVNPRTPAALDAICRKAMSLRPEERYPTPLALAADLEHWLADEPVTAYREPWTARARRWGRRHRALVAGVAAALMVSAAGLTAATVLLSLANRRERDLKEIAERREEEAKEQRDKARANFKLAVEAVNEYCTKVGQDVRLKEQDLTGLRQQLLETAVRFHRKFIEEQGDDPELRAELARAFGRLALLSADLDEPKEAVTLGRQAVDTFKALVAANPDNLAYKHELATAYADLADCYIGEMDLNAAVAASKEALRLWEELNKLSPDEFDYALGVARASGNIGEEVRRLRDWVAAEDWIRRALRTLEALRQRMPKNEKVLKQLARSYRNLANTCRVRGKVMEGIEAGREALKCWQAVAEANPKDPYYRQHLGITLHIVALLYESLPDFDQAAKVFRQAVAIHQSLADSFPSIGSYQWDLAGIYLNMALFQDRTGKAKQATESLEFALKVSEKAAARYPQVSAYHEQVAGTLVKLGAHYGKAAREADMIGAWTKAMSYLERLECTTPEMVDLHTKLASNWNRLVQGRASKGDLAGAAQACRYEATLRKKLAGRVRAPPVEVFRLGVVCRQLCFYLERAKKPEEALTWAEKGTRVLAGVPQDNDQQRQARRQLLLEIYQTQARVLGQLKRHSEAIALWDRALDISSERERTFLRLQRALAIVRSGDHKRAAEEAETLAVAAMLPGPLLYDLGCGFALAAAAARQDLKLPESERANRADKYAARAMEMLTKAKATGFFKAQAQVENLQTDPELDVLRKREDFKALQAEVAPKRSGNGKAKE
jgi:serine/threonine-protein kinase